MISKSTKKRLKRYVFVDEAAASAYRQFQKENPEFDAGEHPISAASYIMRLNWNQYRRNNLDEVRRPKGSKSAVSHASAEDETSWRVGVERPSASQLFENLKQYDVVSFDIFDTALFRKVDKPEDVFRIMARAMGFSDFRKVRKAAEGRARQRKKELAGTREIVLSDIYDLLERDYGIDRKWEAKEIELELAISTTNPYIKRVYDLLLENGNTVVFTSDMYLPRPVIEKLLAKGGYTRYQQIFLSNEYGVNKGEGKLQEILREAFPDSSIVHVGDNKASDVEKTENAGIDAVFNHDQRLLKGDQGAGDGDISGSMYRALINNKMHSGTWEENVHYDYGYRVGGILAAGFCRYLNELAERLEIDKILFCARDCEIVWRIYNRFYRRFDNSYISISRYAILQATSELYFHDFIGRSALRHASEKRSTMTISTVLEEAGFGYLTEKLEEYDIERFLFPQNLKKGRLEEFLYANRGTIIEHNQNSKLAAEQYYSDQVGSAKRILVVDIGWSGTCISALKYLLQQNRKFDELEIFGALMCTSRNEVLTNSVSSCEFDSFLYSPQDNMDLTRFFMPGGRRSTRELDLIHMPLEYLFTSTDGSLARFEIDPSGKIELVKARRTPPNISEIASMQEGMEDFNADYLSYESSCNHLGGGRLSRISPYLASAPLRDAIRDKNYCYEVYKNFVYDALSPLFDDGSSDISFGDLFEDDFKKKGVATNDESFASCSTRESCKGRVLFVSPEMVYTGAPRSLLRICKVAKNAGYHTEVWTAKPGPFEREFADSGISVSCVPESKLKDKPVKAEMASFDIAICNTIVTDAYVRALQGTVPVVWYIREASNIPDFVSGKPERLRTLEKCNGITCVSDYAADAIRKFTSMPIRVVRNAVEDCAQKPRNHVFARKGVVRFLQMGTMEYRKGYDLCIAAYKALPLDYKRRVEMYFAGGFINSGTSYCSYIFSEMESEDNLHYLGLIKDEEEKNRVLSEADVVMVASRDESCSLVALEGAMHSKPLLVTENVGAKYMVSQANGTVVPSGDVGALRDAIIVFVDKKDELENMGAASRLAYEQYASMDAHARDIVALIEDVKSEGPRSAAKKIVGPKKNKRGDLRQKNDAIVVSLTSHPGRIETVHKTIDSLLGQTKRPERIVLWLSEKQFPQKTLELPDELLRQTDQGLEIRWVKEDIKPHKKYFYAVAEFDDRPIVIVDDDVVYDKKLVEALCNSYTRHPHAISCMRANLIMFNAEGEFRRYDNWLYDYRVKRDEPTYQLLPTGVGGVLYPPHSIPQEAFDIDAIQRCCLYGDDLWLKVFTAANGYPVVLPRELKGYKTIENTQGEGLWNQNVDGGLNDKALRLILEHYNKTAGNVDDLVRRIRCIGPYGEWTGVDALDLSSLLLR